MTCVNGNQKLRTFWSTPLWVDSKMFQNSFHPRCRDPEPGGEVELSVEAIEAAGVREVLQTPGAVLVTSPQT